MKYSLTIFIVLAFTLPFFAQPSPFIQVDQFGYKPLAEKVAVLSNPIIGFNSNLSYQPPAMMEVRRAVTNETVLVGDVNLWNGGAV
ncbi:MAG TPA: cellulase N-terminal Ig-like domain-containing protein, partial [Saprospiraceae bacterium]|nr:cellulase N-terminal Ig-like domain-containing protein [Saprospiraceae bacterium]